MIASELYKNYYLKFKIMKNYSFINPQAIHEVLVSPETKPYSENATWHIDANKFGIYNTVAQILQKEQSAHSSTASAKVRQDLVNYQGTVGVIPVLFQTNDVVVDNLTSKTRSDTLRNRQVNETSICASIYYGSLNIAMSPLARSIYINNISEGHPTNTFLSQMLQKIRKSTIENVEVVPNGQRLQSLTQVTQEGFLNTFADQNWMETSTGVKRFIQFEKLVFTSADCYIKFIKITSSKTEVPNLEGGSSRTYLALNTKHDGIEAQVQVLPNNTLSQQIDVVHALDAISSGLQIGTGTGRNFSFVNFRRRDSYYNCSFSTMTLASYIWSRTTGVYSNRIPTNDEPKPSYKKDDIKKRVYNTPQRPPRRENVTKNVTNSNQPPIKRESVDKTQGALEMTLNKILKRIDVIEQGLLNNMSQQIDTIFNAKDTRSKNKRGQSNIAYAI